MGHGTLPKINHANLDVRHAMVDGPDSVVGRWLRPPYAVDGWRIDVANMTGRLGASTWPTRSPAPCGATAAALHDDPLGHRRAQPRRQRRPRRRRLARHDELLRLLLAGVVVAARPGVAGAPVRPTGAGPASRGRSRRRDVPGLAGRARLARHRVESGTSSAPTTPPASAPSSAATLPSHRVAAGLQFTLPGVPMIFAGDEIGLEGVNGEDARRPMPWHRREEWDDADAHDVRRPGAAAAGARRRCAAAGCAGRTSTTTPSPTSASTPTRPCWSSPAALPGGAFTLAGRARAGTSSGPSRAAPTSPLAPTAWRSRRRQGRDSTSGRSPRSRSRPDTPHLALAPRARLGSRPWPCGSSPAGRTRPSCACPGTSRWRSGRTTSSSRCRAASRATSCASCGSASSVYAVKETNEDIAFREYRLLRDLQRMGMPAVVPQGVVTGREDRDGEELPAALITEHLRFSLPYRSLFCHGMDAEQRAHAHRRDRRAAGPAAPRRLLLGRRLAVQRALPPRRRGARRLPRGRRDRRAARGRRRPAAGVRHHRGLREHLRRADGPQRERRGPAPHRRLRDHRAPALTLRGAVARADRPRRSSAPTRCGASSAAIERLNDLGFDVDELDIVTDLGGDHDPHPAQGRRPRPPHPRAAAPSPA